MTFDKTIEVGGGSLICFFVFISALLALVSVGNSMIVISEAIIDYTGLGDSSIGKFFIYILVGPVGFIPGFGQILGAIIAYSVFDWSGWKVMIVFFSVALYIPLFISCALLSFWLEAIFGRIKKTGSNILKAVFITILAISVINVVSNSVYYIYPVVMQLADLSDSFINKMFTFLVAFVVGVIPFVGQVLGAIIAYILFGGTTWELTISFFSPFLFISLVTLWIFTVSVLKAVFK